MITGVGLGSRAGMLVVTLGSNSDSMAKGVFGTEIELMLDGISEFLMLCL